MSLAKLVDLKNARSQSAPTALISLTVGAIYDRTFAVFCRETPRRGVGARRCSVRQQFAADTELVDEICAENEKSSQHLR